jgi:pilus assembly protein Flp/PilA
MIEYVRNLLSMHRERNERGASAVEYGLLVGGIAALIVVLVFALGDNVTSMFDDTCTKITNGSTADTADSTC